MLTARLRLLSNREGDISLLEVPFVFNEEVLDGFKQNNSSICWVRKLIGGFSRIFSFISFQMDSAEIHVKTY